MKKKLVYATLTSVMVALATVVVVVSCSEEESDFDKGKAAGKAFCDCVTAAGLSDASVAACISKLDQSKLVDTEDPAKYTEYQKGVVEAAAACLKGEGGGDE
ncbi:MAG: hypothetical protein LBS63_02060 [Prevotellaceae bacterium]|jgi:hypothetical protein|nr:hypothetical protein [Prevotellaceae bacterium]